MVSGTLDEHEPAFLPVAADLVDLEGHLVVGTLYSGAKGLIGRAVQRGPEQDGALIQLIADREHRGAEPAGVGEPTEAARRDELRLRAAPAAREIGELVLRRTAEPEDR